MLRSLFITLFLIVVLVSNSIAGMIIIVNRDNPVVNISSAQLKQIYNGNLKLWDNGKKIVPVDLSETNPVAINFAKTILGVDIETKRKAWINKLFAGEGTPPRQEKDEASIVSFVASEPGAIGYVKKESANSSVKVITVDGKGEF